MSPKSSPVAKRGKSKKDKKEKVKKVKKEDDGEKRRKKSSYASYNTYIHRLMRTQDKKGNKVQITAKGMAIVNSFVVDLFDRLAGEAGRLTTHAQVKTLSSKAVMAAVKLQLPKELATHALAAGASAVGTFGGGDVTKPKKSKKKN
eukprot:TRINITY_DN135_c1_g1_i1.p2 TRINITY_DN135_c1_g1~~TRINITY_DN135_c1_g1_i1.p2  ORF type:complete len:146 (+),score=73.86 TRINITY_DN135_c1_g1_i1:71-508(+)